MVSIHAPAWGATGGDIDAFHVPAVSIHAPAWGATSKLTFLNKNLLVSIHAPAWGATTDWERFGWSPRSFNPRPRVGGDPIGFFTVIVGTVSIHAPAWGATDSISCSGSENIVSIHAPAWGATIWRGCCHFCNRFQSTPPRGGRPLLLRVSEGV